MNTISEWFDSGWIAYAALVFLWIETGILSLIASDRVARFKALYGGALAGSCLLAALGCALDGQHTLWILGFLTLSLFAHVLDVAGRIKDQPTLLRRNTE